MTFLTIPLAALPFLLSAITPQEVTRLPLKGAKDFYVLLENFTPAGAAFLNHDEIQTQVELRLRRDGIQVKDDSAAAYLYVNINIPKVGSHDYCHPFSVSLEFRESVLLRGQYMGVATWSNNITGVYSTGNESFVKESINTVLDSFINDYLAVNPPQRSR